MFYLSIDYNYVFQSIIIYLLHVPNYVLTLSSTRIGRERNCSTLKTRLKNRLSMNNLDALMLMNLNNDILESLAFEDITIII